jgi:hypothetical protein
LFDLLSSNRQLLRPLDERLRFPELRPVEELFWLRERLPEDRDPEELRRFWPPACRPELPDPDWPDPFPSPRLEPTFSVISLGSKSSSFTLSIAPDRPRAIQGAVTATTAPASPTATGT